MTKKKEKIDVRVGSKLYSLDPEMKKITKKEVVINVSPRTFTLENEVTGERRKIWRYANA